MVLTLSSCSVQKDLSTVGGSVVMTLRDSVVSPGSGISLDR